MSRLTDFDVARYMTERCGTVNAALETALAEPMLEPPSLAEAVRYAVLGAGKRMRPILCLAAAEAAGGEAASALPAAVSIELLHAYTLIHDDLPGMDNDDERRGKPTVHVAFGEALAVLAGDALQALAFEHAARLVPPPPYSGAAPVRELARAAFLVVAGQVGDIEATGRATDAATMRRVYERKTGALFMAAIRIGAIAAGAEPAPLAALSRYAAHLGTTFQTVDDLLDAEEWQKTPIDRRELNCLSVMSKAQARRMAEEETDRAIEALSLFPEERAAPLRGIALLALNRSR